MDISDHISSLKEILISLDPDGPDGFEGLIGTALSKIAGIPFRLAGSGLQFGVDGKSTYADDGISYECKRYTGSVPRAEVMSKIGELSIGGTDTDLWVLCATSQISSQIARDLSKFGKESAISTLILDWSEIGLPPLAVALALASDNVQNFLLNHIKAPESLTKAKDALEAIGKDSEFESHAERIRAILREPTLGIDTARQANTKWLTETFSSRQLARQRFGQPLAPGDAANRVVHSRDNLVAELSPFLTGKPSGKTLCVLGGEGNGKSWLVAQSWLSVEEKPLMVVLSPNVFADAIEQNDVWELLISTLIKQTGGQALSSIEEKWRRVFSQWQNRVSEEVRLVVLIDGLNQRPEKNWTRIVEKFSDDLNQIGGQLIVTVRTQYYQDRIQPDLLLDYPDHEKKKKEIEIQEWTDCERDRILADHGIVAANLQPNVAASLRNPRLLGIALELLEGAAITRLEELNVSRLLFEHIRRNAPVQQSPSEFVSRLQGDAEEAISRVCNSYGDDPTVFSYDLQAVADGRFFRTVEGDETSYTLDEDSLPLALGFAVIGCLHRASRTDRDLDEAVEEIIEPIAALDRTANVILSALTVTCIRNDNPKFAAALIRVFASLQNPDEDEFDSFAHLARTRPAPFMEAIRDLCLSDGYQINFDWIQSALIKARADDRAWDKIFKDIKTWLSYYTPPAERDLAPSTSETLKNKKTKKEKEEQKSLGPAIREHLQAQVETRKEEEKKEREQRTRENIEALSEAEKEILDTLTAMNGDLSTLSRFAFILLAGKPIKPAAQSLMQWSFANSLNSDYTTPYQQCRHLVRFNRIDWYDARIALLKEANVLRQKEISVTGKWALVNVLRATGSPEDAEYERILVTELTKDHPHFHSWRRVDSYCATDPCDPRSEKPDNVKQTAKKYKNIDVSKLWVSRSQNSEGYLFDKARPGMARFEPQVAIAKHREFAQDVVHRKGLCLYQGLLGLRGHNALLRKEQGFAFANLQESEYTDESDLFARYRTLISQYRLLLAFPLLSGREQIDALLSIPWENDIPSEVMDVAKPIDETIFDNLLESACQKGDEHAQYVLLTFAREMPISISAKSRKHVAHLLKAQSERVRVQALGIISQLDDYISLLAEVVHSGWHASKSNLRDEIVNGSAILTQAATYNIIGHSEALDRMAFGYYGRAAQVWSSPEMQDAVREVALRVDAAICRVANIDADLIAPDIEMHVGFEDNPEELISFPDEPVDLAEQLMRLTESAETVEERQKRKYDAYLAFRNELTSQKCDMILDNFYLDEFRTIVEANENLANRWYEMLINVPEARLPAVHNLVLHLAYALSISNPDKAAELFHKVRDSKSLVRVTYYCAAVSLDAMSIWGGPDVEILNKLRFQYLDRTANDHELSHEVLAAHLNGKQDLLRQYIETKLKKEEPAEIARAIMVAGFSDHSEFNDGVLNRYQDTDGFIRDAHNAAQYAYDRNTWARHWFEKMCEADEADEFWCFSILFAKIVDRRYYIWQSEYTEENEPMQLFWPSVRSKLKNRFDRWENLRKKKLFGGDAPNETFLFPEE